MAKITQPTPDDLEVAAEWLETNEGQWEDEQAPCFRVAAWIRQKAHRCRERETKSALRAALRRARREALANRTPHLVLGLPDGRVTVVPDPVDLTREPDTVVLAIAREDGRVEEAGD